MLGEKVADYIPILIDPGSPIQPKVTDVIRFDTSADYQAICDQINLKLDHLRSLGVVSLVEAYLEMFDCETIKPISVFSRDPEHKINVTRILDDEIGLDGPFFGDSHWVAKVIPTLIWQEKPVWDGDLDIEMVKYQATRDWNFGFRQSVEICYDKDQALTIIGRPSEPFFQSKQIESNLGVIEEALAQAIADPKSMRAHYATNGGGMFRRKFIRMGAGSLM